jgi:capsular exopolysaccharide synthesis family protein
MALLPQHSDDDLQLAPPGEAVEIPASREELAVLRQPRGVIAEQYRRLRNSIQALNPDGAPRTVVLTSAVRGEGKSVGTLNLACSLCELPRMRVLVVDADLHRPSLESFLSLPRRKGLAELLRGKLHIDQAVRKTSIEGLSIVGAGARPRNPSELLGSERVRTVLHALKQRFDYVLLDTPPALAINDASLLGGLADGIVLVVRLGMTPRHLVEQAGNLLENLGGNLLGAVLTGAGEEDQSYAY